MTEYNMQRASHMHIVKYFYKVMHDEFVWFLVWERTLMTVNSVRALIIFLPASWGTLDKNTLVWIAYVVIKVSDKKTGTLHNNYVHD